MDWDGMKSEVRASSTSQETTDGHLVNSGELTVVKGTSSPL